MKRLSTRLAIFFLALLCLAGAALTYFSTHALLHYTYEVDQRQNRMLASGLATRLGPLLDPGAPEARLTEAARQILTANPRISIYVLSTTGAVRAHFPRRPLERPVVDVTPVRLFLTSDAYPILGLDPADADHPKPFSAASLESPRAPGFLYVVLGSEHYAGGWEAVAASATGRATLTRLSLVLLSMGFAAVLLFVVLTRPLHRAAQAAAEVASGDYSQRLLEKPADEVGRIAAAFNRTAAALDRRMQERRRDLRLRHELLIQAANDLRASLAATRAWLHRLADGEAESALTPRQCAAAGLKRTEAASGLVRALYQLAELEGRYAQPEPESFSLAELVQDLTVQLAPRARALRVELRTAPHERAPLAYADIILTESTLTRLLEHALRLAAGGGRVEIAFAEAPPLVHTRITALPGEALLDDPAQLFPGDANREGNGAETDLALAKRLTEAQDGHLTVRPDGSERTTITLTLPAQTGAT